MESREQSAERERLRRALYRSGATEADRARYASATAVVAADAADASGGPGAAAAAGGPAPVAAGEPRSSVAAEAEQGAAGRAPGGARSGGAPADRRPPARRLPLLRVVTVGALVVAGAGVALWPLVQAPDPDGAPSASPSASPAASSAPFTAASGAAVRFDAQPTGVEYTDAGVVQRFHGSGSATATLQDDLMPHDGGRLSVVLAPSETALVGWQVRRFVPADGASDQLIASRSGTEGRGVAVPIVFPFVGGPPTTVRVQAPDGVAWALVVTSLRGATAR